MKKILSSIFTIFALTAIVAGGTQAVFVDTESVTGNTFAAGALDLELGGQESVPFDLSDLVPGQSGTGKFTLTNATGSIDGVLDVKLANLVESENGLVEPELAAGDYENGGDLGLESLRIAVFVDVNQDGTWNSGDIKLAYNGQVIPYSQQNYLSYATPRNTVAGWNNIMTMAADASVDVVINWEVLSTWNYPNYNQNIIMTDSLGFDIQTSLEQVGFNGGVAN
jgi:hypothetical protein